MLRAHTEITQKYVGTYVYLSYIEEESQLRDSFVRFSIQEFTAFPQRNRRQYNEGGLENTGGRKSFFKRCACPTTDSRGGFTFKTQRHGNNHN